MADDLERLGYVERTADPADGRAKLIRLTERGAGSRATAVRIMGEIEAEWGERYGDDAVANAARAAGGRDRPHRPRLSGYGALDVVHDLLDRRAGGEHLGHAELLELGNVVAGDGAAHHQDHVLGVLLLE